MQAGGGRCAVVGGGVAVVGWWACGGRWWRAPATRGGPGGRCKKRQSPRLNLRRVHVSAWEALMCARPPGGGGFGAFCTGATAAGVGTWAARAPPRPRHRGRGSGRGPRRRPARAMQKATKPATQPAPSTRKRLGGAYVRAAAWRWGGLARFAPAPPWSGSARGGPPAPPWAARAPAWSCRRVGCAGATVVVPARAWSGVGAWAARSPPWSRRRHRGWAPARGA